MPVEVSEYAKKGTDRVPLLKADSEKMKTDFRLKNPAGSKEIPASQLSKKQAALLRTL